MSHPDNLPATEGSESVLREYVFGVRIIEYTPTDGDGQQYRFEWAGDDTDIAIEPEITTKTQDGLPMRMSKR